MHRNYEGTNAPIRVYCFDDRIEIVNPGGPYGTVTRENFGQPHVTDYRNPTIAEVLRNLGFVQRFGFGIQNARALLKGNGNPPPEFDVSASLIAVTIRKAPT
jgi:ATP-dependent DNA helicase RecG